MSTTFGASSATNASSATKAPAAAPRRHHVDGQESPVDAPASGHMSPTARWLATTAQFMPALEGPAGVAERLLLLIHYGIDWSGSWVARYRKTYWESLLPDRVICATYRSANLRRWWRDISDDLHSRPRTPAERAELERLLRADPLPVLEVLRFETEALLLRTRIVTDSVRTTRAEAIQASGVIAHRGRTPDLDAGDERTGLAGES